MLLAALISLNGEIMSPYSYCAKKGLVCVTIAAPFGRQPFSCLKYTKANTRSSYNIYSVSDNEYTFMLFSDIYNLPQQLDGNT